MGNNTTKEGHIYISRQVYLENVQRYRSVEATNARYTQENERLQSQNAALQKRIRELQSQNESIQIQKRTLESDILKYDGIPVCKTILNMNEQITGLTLDIQNYLNTDSSPDRELLEEVKKVRRNIEELKRNMKGYVNDLPEMKAAELKKLEMDLGDPSNGSRNLKTDRLRETLDKLNEMKEKLSNLIQRALAPVEKELENNRAIFNAIQNNHVDVIYRKIKNILVEQENILLKQRLNMPTTVAGKNDDPKSFKNNEDARQYNLIFCNLVEEFVDGKSDYAKVREILNHFTYVSTTDIRVIRLGRSIPDRPRKIKVTFPNTESVGTVLRHKHKLNGGPYSAIRIFPDKPKSVGGT